MGSGLDTRSMLLSEFALNNFKEARGRDSSSQKFVVIKAFCGESLICDRLYELGLRPGIELELTGRAPLQGPFLFRYQNVVLALRPEEAACVEVCQ